MARNGALRVSLSVTTSSKKKFEIPVDDLNSPDQLFFVHIELAKDKISEALKFIMFS